MYSGGPPHMDVQKQDDQHELTYSNYVRTQDVTLKTCRRRWMIERSGERGSGISVLAARHDDDYIPRHAHKYIIYIYIYIYYHPQTDCFVVSQFISVAKYAKDFKMGWKPGWLYASQISYSRAIVNLNTSEEICTYIFFVYILRLTATRVLSLLEELCITCGWQPLILCESVRSPGVGTTLFVCVYLKILKEFFKDFWSCTQN